MIRVKRYQSLKRNLQAVPALVVVWAFPASADKRLCLVTAQVAGRRTQQHIQRTSRPGQASDAFAESALAAHNHTGMTSATGWPLTLNSTGSELHGPAYMPANGTADGCSA